MTFFCSISFATVVFGKLKDIRFIITPNVMAEFHVLRNKTYCIKKKISKTIWNLPKYLFNRNNNL